jgi:excisionase family DNA binding protein
MPDPVDPLRAIITDVVRETVPLVLQALAPHLVPSDDEPIAVERAPELNLTRRTLEDAIRRGELPGLRLGRKLAAKRSEIVKWRASRAFRPRKRRDGVANDIAASFDDAYEALAKRAAR